MHEITKHTGCPPAGEYTVRLRKLEGGAIVREITVACPKCQNLHGLDAHAVDQDGIVRPSTVCTNPDCDFHDHIRLMDWDSPGEEALED